MTDTHSIAQPFEAEVSPANNRQLTVSYASRYPDCSRIPAITLKGQWLEAAGFATGTVVDVKVMEGCIVLTAQPRRRRERTDAVTAPCASCRHVNRSRCRNLLG